MPDHIYTPPDGDFYVYVYWNPLKPDGPPFYVGKGHGNRAFDHLKPSESKNPHKYRTISNIRGAGLTPRITCAWHGSDESQAFRVERLLIAMWRRRCDGGLLCNVALGGQGSSGFQCSDETKRKMSEAAKCRPKPSQATIENRRQANLGQKRSEESRQRMRLAQAGRKCAPFTEEHRQRISEANKGRKHTEDAKRKISQAHRGMLHSDEAKRKMCVRARQRTHQNPPPAPNYGTQNVNARLTEDDVRRIREMRRTMTGPTVAKKFGVDRSTVNAIYRRKAWKHVA